MSVAKLLPPLLCCRVVPCDRGERCSMGHMDRSRAASPTLLPMLHAKFSNFAEHHWAIAFRPQLACFLVSECQGHPDSKNERSSIAALAFVRCFASSWTLHCGSRKTTVQNFRLMFSWQTRNQGVRIYPDEWHWREGISKPDKFREIVNAWKSSPLVAAAALSARTAQLAAELMGSWTGRALALNRKT
ncbi:unnamed protein product [Symbiodinium sp. CCMP2592]|nr:unnamed protein product [Symbiodinium sp. CCMP2592]